MATVKRTKVSNIGLAKMPTMKTASKNIVGKRTAKSAAPKAQRYAANAKKLTAKKTAGTGTYIGKPVSVSPIKKSTNIGLVPLPGVSNSKTPTRRRRRVGKKRNILG